MHNRFELSRFCFIIYSPFPPPCCCRGSGGWIFFLFFFFSGFHLKEPSCIPTYVFLSRPWNLLQRPISFHFISFFPPTNPPSFPPSRTLKTPLTNTHTHKALLSYPLFPLSSFLFPLSSFLRPPPRGKKKKKKISFFFPFQKLPHPANKNAVPKDNLKATCSLSADFILIPLTCFCIVAVGMMFIPFDAAN